MIQKVANFTKKTFFGTNKNENKNLIQNEVFQDKENICIPIRVALRIRPLVPKETNECLKTCDDNRVRKNLSFIINFYSLFLFLFKKVILGNDKSLTFQNRYFVFFRFIMKKLKIYLTQIEQNL